MQVKTALWPAAVLLCITTSLTSVGSVLPEHYPPQQDARLGPQVDPDLKRWFAEHVDQLPIAVLEDQKYQKLLQGSDRFTKIYIESLRGMPLLRGDKLKELTEALNSEISFAKKESRSPHPLTPYMMQAILSRGGLAEVEATDIEGSMMKVAPRSCPARKVFLKSISKDRLERIPDDALVELFGSIKDYRSLPFRKQSYDIFFSNLSVNRRSLLKTPVTSIVPDIEGLVGKHSWIAGLLDGVAGGRSLKPLLRSREESKSGNCKDAEKFLIEGLDVEGGLFGGKKSKAMLDDMILTGNMVGRCLRRGGVGQALSFWTGVMPRFENVFGFPGKAAVLNRMASLLWNADQIEGAKVFARQMLVEAKAAKADDIILRAEFLLARILDDNKERKEAKELFADFVARNPGDENFEVALTNLVLSQFEDREYTPALESLGAAIAYQDKQAPEKRSSAISSFALFWQGRVHAATKHQDLAINSWRRLATEYYSTYYGVLGHVLYEKATGKKIVLEPSRVPRFSSDFLTAPYSGDDQSSMARVSALFRLGMPADATCELREVSQDASDREQVAARSLALYAGKEWLDAIRLMDSLPRAYRNSLPLGFERIFFPREHENLVFDYAKRLGVDPDFIFALIRQESVFNPKAQSPVGASGLMQLMPATARVEFAKLSKGYIGGEKRAKFSRAMQDRSNLLDPELNVALGIHHVFRLLSKYKSPVFMLAAYNASPTAAEKWSRQISFDDPLIGVERIPYQETRSYVKLIMRNYFYYKRWYVGGQPQMPHLEYLLSKVEKK